MILEEKRGWTTGWTTIGICSLLLILTAIIVDLFGPGLDPWTLPDISNLAAPTTEFPRVTAVSFACAKEGSMLTSLSGACSSVLTSDVTRCPQALPMRSFAEKISCGKPEMSTCDGAGLQTVGLFRGDVFCARSGDVDLGPPPPTVRSEDGI